MRIALMVPEAQDYDLDKIAQSLPGQEIIPWPDCAQITAAELANRCRQVDAVVMARHSPALPEELIPERGRLRLVVFMHGSIKHVITRAHLEAGLLVSNWGDNVFSVAEGALALLLASLKQIPGLQRFLRNDWRDDPRICQAYPCTLRKRRVGLYGFGPIGRHMERLLRPFEAEVAIYDPFAKDLPLGVRVCTSLRELFSTCEIISIHCGLNPSTQGSVTGELLDLLPQGAVLVNTARGHIVDEAALIERVHAGRLLAALDVLENEKRWAQNALQQETGAILSGHLIGGGKGFPPALIAASKRMLPDFVLTNLQALTSGQPLTNLIEAATYDLKT